MNGIKVEPEFENLHTIKQENEEEDWYEDPVPGFSIPGTKDDPSVNFPGIKTECKVEHPDSTEEEEDAKFMTFQTDESRFNAGWNLLKYMVPSTDKGTGGKGKRKLKRLSKDDYEKMIDGLKLRSENGFSEEELLLIWKVATDKSSTMNCSQICKLILLMVPEAKIQKSVILTIIMWLTSVSSQKTKPTVVIAIYQLLNVYVENCLVDFRAISTDIILSRLLEVKTANSAIPWRMRLFRLLVTPEALNSGHVAQLKSMRQLSGLKKTQEEDLSAALGLCKYMRPNFFYNNELSSWKIRALNLPISASVFQTRSACLEKQSGTLHPFANIIFPEFLTTEPSARIISSVVDNLFECWKTEAGLGKIAMLPSLTKAFENWLVTVVGERFGGFYDLETDVDLLRYDSVFRSCQTITEMRQEGIPTLNHWIVDYLPGWDGWVYQKFVLFLIPYLKPSDVLRSKYMLHTALVHRFMHSPDLRFQMWIALESLFIQWMEKVQATDNNELLHQVLEVLKWLLEVFEQCLAVLLFMSEKPESTTGILVERICKFYSDLMKHANGNPSLENDLRAKMLNVPECLQSVVELYASDDSKTTFL